ncbi:MAG: tetratricopeptide repeat protein [Betaproteobacteria bacterium]
MPRMLNTLALSLCALVGAAGAPVRAADTETTPAANAANADFTAGKKAIEAKDWSGAVNALEKAVRKEPKNADAHNLLGYSYRWLGKMDDSFAHYRTALSLEPMHRGAHEYIGIAYLKAKQPAKAKEHLTQLERICGTKCEEYGDLAKAIADYKD